jgi:hypothetical protein
MPFFCFAAFGRGRQNFGLGARLKPPPQSFILKAEGGATLPRTPAGGEEGVLPYGPHKWLKPVPKGKRGGPPIPPSALRMKDRGYSLLSRLRP